MTSEALITTVALAPTFKPSSSTASFVIDDVMTWLGGNFDANMRGGRTFSHIEDFAFDLVTCAQAHVASPVLHETVMGHFVVDFNSAS
jgi:hypothetical protein